MKHLLTIAAILFALSTQAATLDFSFTDNSDNEKGFVIERSIDNITFEQILTLDANITEFTDPDIPLNQEVTYRVYAWNDYGNSGYSNLVTEFTIVPKGPTDFKIKRPNSIARFFKRFKRKKNAKNAKNASA